MSKPIKQRNCTKFSIKNAITANETLKMLKKPLGDESLSRAMIFH